MNQQTNKNREIMDIKFQENDAVRVFKRITNIQDPANFFITKLVDDRMMYGDTVDCGFSVDQIREANGMDLDEFMNTYLKFHKDSEEIPELIKNMIFMKVGSDDPCPDCGCELESETDGFGSIEWTEKKCSNTECEFATTNEPDWDLNRKP